MNPPKLGLPLMSASFEGYLERCQLLHPRRDNQSRTLNSGGKCEKRASTDSSFRDCLDGSGARAKPISKMGPSVDTLAFRIDGPPTFAGGRGSQRTTHSIEARESTQAERFRRQSWRDPAPGIFLSQLLPQDKPTEWLMLLRRLRNRGLAVAFGLLRFSVRTPLSGTSASHLCWVACLHSSQAPRGYRVQAPKLRQEAAWTKVMESFSCVCV